MFSSGIFCHDIKLVYFQLQPEKNVPVCDIKNIISTMFCDYEKKKEIEISIDSNYSTLSASDSYGDDDHGKKTCEK